MSQATSFNGSTAESFASYAETVRGHIRYELVKRNLQPIVSAGVMRIVDIGGGSAPDAIWLAERGHIVTVVDPAEDQLELAEQKIAGLPTEQASRIHLEHGTADDLLERGYENHYDLALSHGVAMYVDEPAVFIQSLARLIKPRHWISLLEKGFYGARNGLLHEGEYAAAAKLESTGKFTNHMGRDAWAFKPEQLSDLLFQAGGWKQGGYSGVRVGHDFDYRCVQDVPADELERIVAGEYEAGHRSDLKAAAPMLHFVVS